MINFCGVVVPYSQIQAFWRYWLYYLDPFTYLIGGLLEPISWDVRVQCKPNELTHIPLPLNTTCGEYIADFLATNTGYISDPENTTMCSYCQYQTGADYMRTLNINNAYYGWRDVGNPMMFQRHLNQAALLPCKVVLLTTTGWYYSFILLQQLRSSLFDDEA